MWQILSANASGKVRKASLHGREYLVADATMIVPGVLPGSSGKVLYTKEEIARNPDDWNWMPIVVSHPMVNGSYVSARDPEILNKQGIGVVMRSKAGDKLKAELWFDVHSVKNYDHANKTDILKRLRKGELTELSTGLFSQKLAVNEGATFNGRSYDFVARNIKPDHLAILLDEPGACSIKDGCGVFNRSCAANKGEAMWVPVTANVEMSYEQRMEACRSAFRKAHPLKQNANGMTDYESACYISAVFDDYVVYREGETLYRQYYTTRGNKIEFDDEQTPVEMQVEYVPISNKETPMPLTAKERKAIVSGLQANCACFKSKADAAILANLSDKALVALKDNVEKTAELTVVANAATAGFQDPKGTKFRFNAESKEWEMEANSTQVDEEEEVEEDVTANADDETPDPEPEEGEETPEDPEPEPEPAKPAANKKVTKKETGFQPVNNMNKPNKKPAAPARTPVKKPVTNSQPRQMTSEEWLQYAPPPVRKIVDDHRAALVEQIMVNVDETEQEEMQEFLANKSFDELERLAKISGGSNQQTQQPNYVGAGGPPVTVNNHQQPLGKPNYDWSRK